MTYLIETYGCQMNKAESAAMESVLREKGWEVSGDSKPDLVLINTCSVRATAENRAWARISQHAAEKRHRPLSIVVTGCMAEQGRTTIRERIPEVDYVLGTFQKQSFGAVLDAILQGRRVEEIDETPAFVFAPSHYEPGEFRAFVPIMHGCDNFCSYCIVPYLRGREISRSPEAILAELDNLEKAGVREVTLLGQNVNSYKWEDPSGPLDFPGLLKRIALHLESGGGGIGWIRFLTSHPKDLSDELIAVLASEPLYCRHVHLCVQSGSDPVLAAMNRKYDRAYYLALVDRMKASIPGLSLSSDILVGFPGETEEDVEATLDLMRRVGFTYSFMYYFNPREGTPAVNMPGKVSDKVKKARLARVIEVQKEITAGLMNSRIGAVDEVLIEGISRKSRREVLARTQRDEMVVFEADAGRVGQFARVRLTGLSGNTFRAVEEDAERA
ncbi:MAG: tRNA (N6-isopentenyl adenosine(37)-C2)-methylthiotransferase MiaB [Rectinemataceae bacterium]